MAARWLVLFVVCTLANGIGGQWWRTAEPLDFGVESTNVASSILNHGEFRDPYEILPTGPTAHVAPAYPLLYGAIGAVFGTGNASWWAIRLLTLAVYSLSLALLPVLAFRLGLSTKTGLVASALGCTIPIPGSCYKWEALYTGLLLVALACLFARLHSRPAMTPSVLTGLLCGLVMLFSPAVLLVLVVWGILIGRHVPGRMLAWIAGLALLVITPWIVRNYRVFGAFVFVRGNIGTEMASSNNDCGSAWSDVDKLNGCFALHHPNANLQLARRIVEVGEYRFNRERLHIATEWIAAHPQRFAVLTAKRFLLFWLPVAAGGKSKLAILAQAFVSLLTLVSIPGLVMMYRKHRFAAQILISGLICYPLINYLIHINFRYRYPILWITCLAVAYLFVEAPRRASGVSTHVAQRASHS